MFGDVIRKKREIMRLTQEDLAAQIDIELTRQTISNWERGNAYPEVEKLLVLATVLNLSLDEMFSEELLNNKSILENPMSIQTSALAKDYPGLITGMLAFSDALRKLKHGGDDNDDK